MGAGRRHALAPIAILWSSRHPSGRRPSCNASDPNSDQNKERQYGRVGGEQGDAEEHTNYRTEQDLAPLPVAGRALLTRPRSNERPRKGHSRGQCARSTQTHNHRIHRNTSPSHVSHLTIDYCDTSHRGFTGENP